MVAFSDWFGTKRTVVNTLNRKMANTIWFRFHLISFVKDFSLWGWVSLQMEVGVNAIQTGNNGCLRKLLRQGGVERGNPKPSLIISTAIISPRGWHLLTSRGSLAENPWNPSNITARWYWRNSRVSITPPIMLGGLKLSDSCRQKFHSK